MGRCMDRRLVAFAFFSALASCTPGARADDEPAAEPPAENQPAQPAAAPAPFNLPFPLQRMMWGARGWKGWRGFAVPAPAAEKEDEQPERGVALPDNGDLRRRLEQVRQQLVGEHYADATRQLSQWLQDPDVRDFFLSRDEERRGGRSFLTEIRRLVEQLPPAGLAVYRLQSDAQAKHALQSAVARGGEAPLREIVRRYPGTTAAAEARFRLGHALWDHGRP